MQKSLLKVVCLGDAGVGKTSVIRQFVENNFSKEYKPTIGADFLTQDMQVDGKTITLQIWDTAGQERFKSMAVSFYRGADACVLCYDITDPTSFKNLDMWISEFCENAGKEIDVAKYPFCVIGNKADLAAGGRQISLARAKAWCQSHHDMELFETSAVTRQNLKEAFDHVVRLASNPETMASIPHIAQAMKPVVDQAPPDFAAAQPQPTVSEERAEIEREPREERPRSAAGRAPIVRHTHRSGGRQQREVDDRSIDLGREDSDDEEGGCCG